MRCLGSNEHGREAQILVRSAQGSAMFQVAQQIFSFRVTGAYVGVKKQLGTITGCTSAKHRGWNLVPSRRVTVMHTKLTLKHPLTRLASGRGKAFYAAFPKAFPILQRYVSMAELDANRGFGEGHS